MSDPRGKNTLSGSNGALQRPERWWDSDGVIVDAIRHVNSEMSRVRTLLPGDEYHLPPRQEKLDPGGDITPKRCLPSVLPG